MVPDAAPAPRGAAALPIGLRNRLAELILDAFDAPEARETLAALGAFCRSAGGVVGPGAMARLTATGWFEAAGPGRVRLLGAHRAYRAALCRRADAAAVLAARPALPEGRSVAGLLERAALLAGAGLYFEVHELIEPAWMRAEGDARLALQGLIQVAVGLHHTQQGNREGAISLLAEGLAKLGRARSALPLDTAAWEAGLAAALAALRGGRAVPPVPAWPSPERAFPREAAWRSS